MAEASAAVALVSACTAVAIGIVKDNTNVDRKRDRFMVVPYENNKIYQTDVQLILPSESVF
jgi:hypothetical protein